MLTRVLRQFLSKRVPRDQFAYRVADPTPEHEAIDSLRNQDYPARRKEAIAQFNHQLHTHNRTYKGEIKASRAQTKSSTKAEQDKQDNQESDETDRLIQTYKTSIDGLSQQFSRELKQIDEEERTSTVKIYLAENVQNENQGQKQAVKAETGLYVPNRLILKKLYQCSEKEAKLEDPSQQVLLVGVEPEEDHCLFLAKLLEQFEVKNVVTMLPPDLPFFIKTEGSFLDEWRKFIENPSHAKKTKFYVNPKPKLLNDVRLSAGHFPLVRESLARSSSFLDTHYYLMKENELNGKYEPLPLLAGLCSQTVENLYLGDFPVFQERKMLADNLELTNLRELFQEFLLNFKQLKLKFAAQWLFPPEILRKKMSHIVKVTKAVVGEGNGRTLLLCPAEVAELVSIEWQLGRDKHESSQLCFDYSQEASEKEQTFMEHIQKLVILDLIMQPVITRYFVKFRSFPFLCHHTLGGKQNIGKVFIVWMHFYNLYYEQLSERRLEDNEKEQLRKSFMDRYEDPTNFT